MSVASESQTSVVPESKSYRSLFTNLHNKGFDPPKEIVAYPHNRDIRKILDVWTGYGFPIPEPYTKNYGTVIWMLKKILKGTYFFRNPVCPDELRLKKFTADEIIQTIDYLNLAAYHPNYYPFDEKTKQSYRRTSLALFFFQKFAKIPYSLFLQYHTKPPKEYNPNYVKAMTLDGPIDKNLHKSIIKEYSANLPQTKFSKSEDILLKKAAILTKTFFADNSHLFKIPLAEIGKERFMARWLIRSVIGEFNGKASKISPYTLVQPWVYNRILPSYLHDQAIINIKSFDKLNFSSFQR